MPPTKRIKLEQPEVHEAESSTAQNAEELPPYHEYHSHRNLRTKAQRWMKDKKLNLQKLEPTQKKLLRPFLHRYHAGIEKPEDRYCHLEFANDEGWVKATLTVSLTTERCFEGEWCWNEDDAEVSAVEAFRSDEEVLEIAENLPPTMGDIEKTVTLRREEIDRLHEANILEAVVMKELVQAVYIHFRELGCRTALWDSEAHEAQSSTAQNAEQPEEELPPYHEYHSHRNLRSKAEYLMRDKGLNLANLQPTVKKLLRPF